MGRRIDDPPWSRIRPGYESFSMRQIKGSSDRRVREQVSDGRGGMWPEPGHLQAGEIVGRVHVEGQIKVEAHMRGCACEQAGFDVAPEAGRPEGWRDHVRWPQQERIGALAIVAGRDD